MRTRWSPAHPIVSHAFWRVAGARRYIPLCASPPTQLHQHRHPTCATTLQVSRTGVMRSRAASCRAAQHARLRDASMLQTVAVYAISLYGHAHTGFGAHLLRMCMAAGPQTATAPLQSSDMRLLLTCHRPLRAHLQWLATPPASLWPWWPCWPLPPPRRCSHRVSRQRPCRALAECSCCMFEFLWLHYGVACWPSRISQPVCTARPTVHAPRPASALVQQQQPSTVRHGILTYW
jgi:hypothetical protein